MNNNKLQTTNTNAFLNKIIQNIPKPKRTIEQQDNESLNTMDYYKEENSSRNNKLIENKFITNANTKHTIDINSKIKIDCPNSSYKEKTPFSNKNLGGLYEEIKFARNNSFFENDEKEENVEKRFETMKHNNDYCIKCNSEIEFPNHFCPHCIKPFCKKCINRIFNRNLDNNDDKDIYDHKNINNNICPNCRNSININDIGKFKSITFNNYAFDLSKSYEQPFFGQIKNGSSNSQKVLEQKEFVNKEFNEQNQQYDLLLKKIEKKKREIEIKKNLNMNLIQILQKSIETEYNYNLNTLNEMCLKIQKIQDSIKNRKNLINGQKNFNNAEMLNLVEKYQKVMITFSKNYQKLEQKIVLKSKPKAYKVYEANPLRVNFAETYYMKEKEFYCSQHIGKAYIKIDRFVNNYTNCLNFSVSIKKDENNSQKNNPAKNGTNLDNKSRYVIYMIVNNKLIKLNKNIRDNNKSSLNYEGSLEESFVFNSKVQSTDINRSIKKDYFDVKIIITELFL